MKMDPHKSKYFDLYWEIAHAAAAQSVAQRRKVGAAVVTPTGMISIGWNGMPAGMDNCCEESISSSVHLPSLGKTVDLGSELKTRPEVIHAERNAIDKMIRQGVPVAGSLLFVTLSPCLECAKSIHGLGFEGVYYEDTYRDLSGVKFLMDIGVECFSREELALSEAA